MRLRRFQFGLRTALIAVLAIAIALWAWPRWQRYRALRSLNTAVEGAWATSSVPVKGPAGAPPDQLPDFSTLKVASDSVRKTDATEEAVKRLVAQLRAHDVQVRTNAAIALGELGRAATSALPELVIALEDDAVVACHAAVALGRIGETAKPAVPPLADILRDGQKYVVLRYNAAVALGQLGEFGALLEVMEQEQTPWLYNAFAAIGPTAKDVFPSLAEMLKSSDPAVRVAAAHALGGIATHAKEAVALIEQLADDEDTSVRTAAAQSLANIEREKKRASAMKK